MTRAQFVDSVTRTIHKGTFQLKKHSPEILAVTGTVGVVVGAVMACKATTKINLVLEETKLHVDTIHTGVENGEAQSLVDGEIKTVPYNEEDSKKDLAIVYAKTGLKLAKLYAPAVIVGAAGLGCLLSANNILRKRNMALAAAYMAEHTGFKEYRGRVIDRFGEELDRELKYNLKAKEVEEVVIGEDGTEHTEKKVVNTIDSDNPNNYSPYAIIFDNGNIGWDEDPALSKYFLVQQQNYANDKLRARGHLFLNEVYDMLGAPRTKIGQTVGWVYDKNNERGDNYVDFGIFNIHKEKARDFVNGYEKVVVLDFNVDGDIYSLMR